MSVKGFESAQTLHIYKDPSVKSQSRRTFVFTAGDEIPSYHDRQKRSVSLTDAPAKNPNITVKVSVFILITWRFHILIWTIYEI